MLSILILTFVIGISVGSAETDQAIPKCGQQLVLSAVSLEFLLAQRKEGGEG